MSSLKDYISKSKSIAIISHVNPDGDSLGSSLALGMALNKIHSNITVFIPDVLPGKYKFLPDVHLFTMYKSNNPLEFDITFILDCGDIKRLGNSIDILNKSKLIVNIDHHASNNSYGDINIIDSKASSTSEMIYNLIKDLNIHMDKAIATCLYVGIITDTGNFRYDNTSPSTHLMASKLLELGVNINDVVVRLYQSNPYNYVRFLGEFLSNMELILDGKVAIAAIPLSNLRKYDVPTDELDNIINYGRDIEGVEIAVTLKETANGEVKLSFRGKEAFDVNVLAKAFGGGGHKKASGATVVASIEEVKRKVIEEIEKIIKTVNN